MILLFSNSFAIFYIIVSPLLFHTFNKHYYPFVLISTFVTGIGGVGRYLAGTNYDISLFMTIMVAVAHIPIITAPYGLLKLFPDWQKGYAASVPMFLPVLAINFCILYGMAYISTGQEGQVLTLAETHNNIEHLNGIIAIFGVVSSTLTILLFLKFKDVIIEENTQDDIVDSAASEETTNVCEEIIPFIKTHKHTMIILVCWGTIMGINWTYGALFDIIF